MSLVKQLNDLIWYVDSEIDKIDKDPRFHYDIAIHQIDAPLALVAPFALVQCSLESRMVVLKEIKILTEKIQNALYRAFPSPNKKEDKIGRLDLLKKAFDTDSWTDVCSLRYEDLEVGFKILESEIKKEAK